MDNIFKSMRLWLGVGVKETQIQAGVLLGIAPHHTPQILRCTPNLFLLSSIC